MPQLSQCCQMSNSDLEMQQLNQCNIVFKLDAFRLYEDKSENCFADRMLDKCDIGLILGQINQRRSEIAYDSADTQA